MRGHLLELELVVAVPAWAWVGQGPPVEATVTVMYRVVSLASLRRRSPNCPHLGCSEVPLP